VSEALLDLRSPGTRLLQQRWQEAAPAYGAAWPAGRLARLGEALVGACLARRARLRGTPPPGPLVVSLGNLRVGGTGKTPVVIALAAELERRGHRGAIVTRGYGSRLAGPVRVRPHDPAAGDEARLMAGRVPGWPVIQARDRRAGLEAALGCRSAVEIVLLEDAHQSAGAARHLDVLILDRWAAIWLVELGQAEPEPVDPWRGQTAGRLVPVAPFRRRIAAGQVPPGQERYGVISGVARPERFEATCRQLTGRPAALVVRCDDHCRYGRRLLARIGAAGTAHGLGFWLTTEKDWLKMVDAGTGWCGPVSVRVLRLGITWLGREALPDLIEERLADHRARAEWSP
jgi:tetraacyldisaccharide 4'-kinase